MIELSDIVYLFVGMFICMIAQKSKHRELLISILIALFAIGLFYYALGSIIDSLAIAFGVILLRYSLNFFYERYAQKINKFCKWLSEKMPKNEPKSDNEE